MKLYHALVLSLLSPLISAIDTDRNPKLVSAIRLADTVLDKANLLPNNSQWLFDFTVQPNYKLAKGGVVNADSATFPAVTDQGMSMGMINLGACAVLPPIIHPRATSMVVAINGTTDTYMIIENGAKVVQQTLTHGKMTIFPQASVYTMMNTGCEPAQLVSALNNEDGGVQNLVNALGRLPQTILAASGLHVLNSTAIPPIGSGIIPGQEACIAKCAKSGKHVRRSEAVVW